MPADGQTYTVRGHITGPQDALADPRAVTLFLPGLGYGEFFTTYDQQPGYDFAAEQAAAGHALTPHHDRDEFSAAVSERLTARSFDCEHRPGKDGPGAEDESAPGMTPGHDRRHHDHPRHHSHR